jgi:hypothetical protein
MPLLCVMDLIRTMVESSSVEEEDREFDRERANEQVISTRLQDSPLYPLSRRLGKHRAWCLVLSLPTQPTPSMTRGPRVHLSDDMGKTTGNSNNKAKCPHKSRARHAAVVVILGTTAVNASMPMMQTTQRLTN